MQILSDFQWLKIHGRNYENRSPGSKVKMNKHKHKSSIKTACKSIEEAWISRLPKGFIFLKHI